MEDGMGASTVGESKSRIEQATPAKSFAEEALRLSGKSEEEVRRTGDVDKAEEQVESMFAPQYQTTNRPVHRAGWGRHMPLQLLVPRLAGGQALSAFALTEPCAGSDLTDVRTTAVAVDDYFEVTGEKLFITNAIPGRMIGLVVMLERKPAVLIAELPIVEDEHFRIVPYGLYALQNAYNNGLRFNRFPVPK